MHFLQNYNRRRTGKKSAIAIGVALVLVALAFFQPTFLTKIFLAVARPLHLVRQDAVGGVREAVDRVQSKEELIEENRRLAEELQRARIKASLFDELRGTRAREDSSSTSQSISASVLSSPPFSPYDTLIVDAGTRSGVSIRDIVLYDDTVALGSVDTVTEKTSRVQLFSSPGIEQSVRIGGHDFLVTARGIGGGSFQMLVLKSEEVTRGDGVFLPDGRLLARVDGVVQDESDAFALVSAVVPFNLFELREVQIESAL